MSPNVLSQKTQDYVPNTVQNGAYHDPDLGPIKPDTLTWSRTIDWGERQAEVFFDYRFDMSEPERSKLAHILHAFMGKSDEMAAKLTAFMVEEILKNKSHVAYYRKFLDGKNLRQELQDYLENNRRSMWIWLNVRGSVTFDCFRNKDSLAFIWVNGHFNPETGLYLKNLNLRKK